MMAVLPLWCASTLVAYLLGHLLLGPKHGFASLVMLGGIASGGLLALAGHPLPGIVIGAVSGGVCGALLVRWTGTLRWGPATQGATEEASPLPLRKPASTPASKPAPKPAPKPNRAPNLDLDSEAPELDSAVADVTGPLQPVALRAKETPASKASAARSGSYSAVKTGKKSKRKRSSDATEGKARLKAGLEDESMVAIGTMLEDSVGGSVDRTAALGTVSRAERTMAGFDPATRSKNAERGVLRSSTIPRGVFATDGETPLATDVTADDVRDVTADDVSADDVSADGVTADPVSGFDEPTENLDGEIAPTHCPRCRAKCSPEARYCAGCSAPVMPWGCKECGHQNHAEADFCVRCQAPVELLASPVDVEILDE